MLHVVRVNAVKAYGGMEGTSPLILKQVSGQINATAELQPPTPDEQEVG